MLRKDAARAVKEGQFKIYTVATVDEAIAILTGMPAGERLADGAFPEGTVNFLVDKRLRKIAKKMTPTKRARKGIRRKKRTTMPQQRAKTVAVNRRQPVA